MFSDIGLKFQNLMFNWIFSNVGAYLFVEEDTARIGKEFEAIIW